MSPNRTQQYFWTPELDEKLRVVYAKFGRQQSKRGVTAAAAKATGMPESSVKARAGKLGLTYEVRRMWSAEEVDFLRENAGIISTKQIAKRLNRGFLSVEAQMERMRISRRRQEGYTAEELEGLFGISDNTLRRWERAGMLRRVRGFYRDGEIATFLRSYPQEYDLSRIEQFWFKSLVFPNAACFTSSGFEARKPRSCGRDDEFEAVQTFA